MYVCVVYICMGVCICMCVYVLCVYMSVHVMQVFCILEAANNSSNRGSSVSNERVGRHIRL